MTRSDTSWQQEEQLAGMPTVVRKGGAVDTGRKQRRGTRRRVIAGLLAAAAAWAVPTCAREEGWIGRVPGQVLTSGDHGVTIYSPRTGVRGTYVLRTRAGEPIEYPAFTVWKGHVVYFSPWDGALAMVGTGGRVTWLPIAGQFDNPDWAGSLVTQPRGAILDRLPVVRVDLPSGRNTVMPGVLDVCSSEKSDIIAVLTDRGNLEIWEGSDHRILLRDAAPPGDRLAWDYDFESHVLAFIKDGHVHVRGPGISADWSTGSLLYWPEQVHVDGKDGQIWVTGQVDIPFAAYLLKPLLYDYHGQLIVGLGEGRVMWSWKNHSLRGATPEDLSALSDLARLQHRP